MTKIDDPATVSNATVEALSTPHGRALAAFEAATLPTRVLLQANGTTVEILCGPGGDYRMAVNENEVKGDKGALRATLETVKRLVAGLEAPRLRPTPTARYYEQYGFWADVQNSYFMCYAAHSDGGWDDDPAAVEFACQHMIDSVNADFGTDFTMDEFQEGDACTCAD